MVASANADLYTPFPHPGPHFDDSGPQSSEDGSGLHSPIYDSAFHPDIRYHGPAVAETLPTIPQPYDSHYALPTARIAADAAHPFLRALDVPASPHAGHAHRPQPPSPDRSLLMFNSPGSLPRLPPPNPGVMDYSYSFHDRRLPEPHSSSYHKPIHPLASPDAARPLPAPSYRNDEPSPSTSASRETRKPSSMTVIACRQCRARKIRCDSTRPMCNNCLKRGNECEYDAVPKRRGPDKHPGTRQRSCKKRAADDGAPGANKKKRRTVSEQSATPEVKENVSGGRRSPNQKPMLDAPLLQAPAPPTATSILELPLPGMNPDHAKSTTPYGSVPTPYRRGSAYDVLEDQKGLVNVHRSPQGDVKLSPPSGEYQHPRKTWWDELVATYTPSQEQSVKAINEDLAFLFNTTNLLLAFINVPNFLRALNDPTERERTQPALVYAALAVATLLKSSEVELGASGRQRALWFRQAAQAALESSWTSQWVDSGLAAAALLLAIFETSAHPHYSPEGVSASLSFLDSIIRTLNLTAIDAHDPDVSTFARGRVPVVYRSTRYPAAKECSCRPLLEEEQLAYTWSSTPAWDPAWTDSEIRREECRRLCWSALGLVSDYVAQCALTQEKPPNLFLADPSNYKLLFPGEMLSRSLAHHNGQSPKESVWALHSRSMLLWNSCQILRDSSIRNEERAEFAIQAWGEAEAISQAIDRHTCNVDTALIYACREFVYNTRLTVTHNLRRLVPYSEIDSNSMFNRKHAEEWLHYQEQLAKRVKASIHHLSEAEGQLLTRRPFCVTWFASQISTCLSLWRRDRGLVHALELAKSFLVPLDVLNALWPCPNQKSRCDDLRDSLDEACASAGIPPPLPAHYSLPPMLRQ
ncbi:hypothetical protein GLOTRDRAFT_137358 [Gloeophyllum trabeum ATCC 11539]|uniref:Zn(2)-C6 fungal-type domain-containing protein n=1 Tax=Gloeophyllum trabeum (strain ATCC 11539 / FP-39264 / Madison 617) TaxID=670483 RepID=S7RQK0_GLOTA|nr:uncharacterized protein GLOTRDRAFT_137358 [Gloeophyllum trabeum ATCC 11539]EPQ56860.1 hypothetical protein GLOTRDRAFT_137358 [Gloeophyllum trabeum ATCC 11539]